MAVKRRESSCNLDRNLTCGTCDDDDSEGVTPGPLVVLAAEAELPEVLVVEEVFCALTAFAALTADATSDEMGRLELDPLPRGGVAWSERSIVGSRKIKHAGRSAGNNSSRELVNGASLFFCGMLSRYVHRPHSMRASRISILSV